MQQIPESLHRFFSTDQVLPIDLLITVIIYITFQDESFLLDDRNLNAALKRKNSTSQSLL